MKVYVIVVTNKIGGKKYLNFIYETRNFILVDTLKDATLFETIEKASQRLTGTPKYHEFKELLLFDNIEVNIREA